MYLQCFCEYRETNSYTCSYVAWYPVHWLHPLADLLIPTPTQLLWEAFSNGAITARRQFTHITITVYRHELI